MHFASLPPWWLVAAIAAALALLAYGAYRRPLVPLSAVRSTTLIALRFCALAAIVLLLWRPITLLPPRETDAVIPILVDTSRSMRVVDGPGTESRLARAVSALQRDLIPALAPRFRPEIYTVGDRLAAASFDELDAGGRQTDLSGALEAVRDRFRGRRLAGIVLVSDGGDTGPPERPDGGARGAAVFTVGVGNAAGLRDREVLSIVAGDPRLDQAVVDLHVSASSSGYGRQPFELRLRANGDVIETRSVTPAADGSPVNAVFSVSPDPLTPNVYAVEIETAADELIAENNSRTILVSPAGRKRRILALLGAPGFEHSFLARTLARDPGLELDIVVRKGKNEAGQHTFFVQATSERAQALLQGFPAGRDALYRYDAIIVANVEGDFFTETQLASIAEFAGKRGGGVLVLGGQSFTQKGLMGTALEEVLPVELNDRRSPLSRAAVGDVPVRPNTVSVTAEGEGHPVTRIGGTPEEVRTKWAALPALAATTPLGGPRPGASILAVTAAPSGIAPVVAVQRYGAGRSMVFAGEASWRWRMMRPAGDRSYDQFWRQALRWLAGPAPDPVSITTSDAPEPGDLVTVAVEARNAAFEPVPDATVRATITQPGGATADLPLKREAAASGRFTGAWQPEQPGLYRIQAEATHGRSTLGSADRWVYVGGSDRELADPRLNEGVLRRIARDSGGRYVTLDHAGQLASSLDAAVPAEGEPERRDLWHHPAMLVLILLMLSAEWILRRRWGLR